MKNLRYLFIAMLVSVSVGFLGGCVKPDGNKPPSAPSIACPIEAKVDEKVTITVRSTDPNGNEIAYKVRYGDGTDSEWSDYFTSGQSVAFVHKYTQAGDYRIKAVASDREAVGTWSEDRWIKIKTDLPPPRSISILGTCLPGCEGMWKDLGGTHFYGNRYYWPDYDLVEELGMKVFVNIRADDWRFSLEEQEELSQLREHVKNAVTEAKVSGSTEALAAPQFEASFRRYKELLLKSIPNDGEIRRAVNAWKDRPGCGGYWSDTLGHEPDITDPPMEERERFYNTIRELDPDKFNHPVMEMMDLTEYEDFPDGQYPGWKYAFTEYNDVLLIDCYVFNQSDAEMEKWITHFFRKFIVKYCKKNQVIPQVNAFEFREGSISTAYRVWQELLSSDEFDNPYRGSKIGLAYYKDQCVRENPEMQREIAEVNAKIAK